MKLSIRGGTGFMFSAMSSRFSKPAGIEGFSEYAGYLV